MNVLLTGGLGFIGSHVSVFLSDKGYNTIIVDNLSNSNIKVLENIKEISKNPQNIHFMKADVNNYYEILGVFEKHKIDYVIHFASLKSVNESIMNPLLYYNQNLNGLIILLEIMNKYNCKKIIFSSSATVYGSSNIKEGFSEDMQIGVGITNPYGFTKYFQEQILKDYQKANPEFCVTILRYFNPVGAHPSGLIGETPNNTPNNIFPYLLNVASGKYSHLTIFGDDYDTPDGTCIRDFIHVMDLADGHSVALENFKKELVVYNLGTGKGSSVFELVKTFQDVNNVELAYCFAGRREGDVPVSYANVSKIYKELGWKTKYTLEDVCKDGYNYLLKCKYS